VYAEYRVSASLGAIKNWSIDNPSFVLSSSGQVDYAVLSQVPNYQDAANLSVYIEFPGNPAANVWRYLSLATAVCNPSPPYCPPGQICDPPMYELVAKSTSDSRSRLTNQQGLSIYPNPADASVTLELPTPTAAQTTLTIMDLLGRVVHAQTVSLGEQRVSLNVAKLPTGSYILLVGTAKGTSSQRFVVSR
jgi:hypothetical protein